MTWADAASIGGEVLSKSAWGFVILLLYLLLKQRADQKPLDLQSDKQRVELGIQMLETARQEIHRLNLALTDAQAWSDVQNHLLEAERHMGALIDAEQPGELRTAKRRASAFMIRMARLREARGVARNELQIRESEERLADDAAE